MSNNGSQNNLLATLILIIVIVILIYFLTKSKDYNLYESEPISNNDIKKNVDLNNPNNFLNPNKTSQKKVSFQTTEDTIYNYTPNDNNESIIGADISNAFDNPLPPESRIDVIDLNKNNVKNYNAKDYLPKEINEEWFDTDFSQAKYNINDDNLINVDRYIIGINTVGQSLKNASYDIRGTVANPKFSISPWNNSTIEPDYNIKSLC